MDKMTHDLENLYSFSSITFFLYRKLHKKPKKPKFLLDSATQRKAFAYLVSPVWWPSLAEPFTAGFLITNKPAVGTGSSHPFPDRCCLLLAAGAPSSFAFVADFFRLTQSFFKLIDDGITSGCQ